MEHIPDTPKVSKILKLDRCGCLNENDPYRIIDLNVWSPENCIICRNYEALSFWKKCVTRSGL